MTADRFAGLREHDPVHWHAPSRAWIVTRYADVVALLADPRLTSRTVGDRISGLPGLQDHERAELTAFFGRWLSLSDGPVHRGLRRAVAPLLSGARVEPWVPVVQRLAEEQARSLRRDAVEESFARPYVSAVLAHVLGLTPAEFPPVLRATGTLLRLLGTDAPTETQARSAVAALNVVDTVERSPARRSGSASRPWPLLADASLPGELRGAALVQLVAGGYDPLVRSLTAFAADHRPSRVRPATRAAAADASEAVLRARPPFELLPRIVVEPLLVGDRLLTPGGRVLLAVGSANRDGSHAGANPHVSFGAGRHRCPASALARSALAAGAWELAR